MSNYWVIAADAGEARLFTRDKKYGPLTEHKDWLHPESRLHGQDLETDRPGRSFASHGYGQSDMEPGTDPKKQEAERFATDLAHVLNEARARGDFQHLQIVAAPAFLGMLRDRLDSETRDRIDRAVDKNVTKQAAEQIAATIDAAG
jgi:protein required for attachment to host cells